MIVFEDMEQQSPAWHSLRQTHIGSSDVPIILWMDPWGNTPFALFKEKVGGKKRSTWDPAGNKEHGVRTEATARDWAAQRLGDFFAPAIMGCDEKGLEFMLASLDGINHDYSEISEVKCPLEIGTHLQAKEGRLGDHYYAQVQHQLYVTKAKVCHFTSWFTCRACLGDLVCNGDPIPCPSCKGTGGEGIMVNVAPDLEYQAAMIAKEREFWGWVQSGKYPIPKGDLVLEPDPVTLGIAEDYAQTIAMMREVENRQRQLKARLLGLRPDVKRLTVGPIEINWTYKAGYTEKKPREVSESLSCTLRRIK